MILDRSQYPQVLTNSTSYVDLAGLSSGLDRLVGESSDEYLLRLRAASRLTRGSQYEGLLNEINLELGLLPGSAMLITDTTGEFELHASLRGLTLGNSVESLMIPLITYDPDDFWNWRPLSDVAADVSASASFSVASVAIDGFAYQIAQQSNRLYAVGEQIGGQSVQLSHGSLVKGSEVFSTPVSFYSYGNDGRSLHFTSPVPDGCSVSYSYRICPWNLIHSNVGIMSLLDPDLAVMATAPSGNLVYQVREYLQALVSADRSYWAR